MDALFTNRVNDEFNVVFVRVVFEQLYSCGAGSEHRWHKYHFEVDAIHMLSTRRTLSNTNFIDIRVNQIPSIFEQPEFLRFKPKVFDDLLMDDVEVSGGMSNQKDFGLL